MSYLDAENAFIQGGSYGNLEDCSVVVMGDWILGATNTVPAAGALTVFAIHQADASNMLLLQPYVDDPIPPLLSKPFTR